MEAQSAAPVLTPHRSRYLLLFITLTHAGAMVAACASGLTGWLALLITACLLLSWAIAARRWHAGGWCGAGPIRIDRDGTWLEGPAAGPVRRFQPLPPLFVHPALIVVSLRALDGPMSGHDIVLLPDSLPAADARRLRVWLRLHHAPD